MGGYKVWLHSHLPVTDTPEYPPWAVTTHCFSVIFRKHKNLCHLPTQAQQMKTFDPKCGYCIIQKTRGFVQPKSLGLVSGPIRYTVVFVLETNKSYWYFYTLLGPLPNLQLPNCTMLLWETHVQRTPDSVSSNGRVSA